MNPSKPGTCWVSGSTGLIGRHVVTHLLSRGFAVRALVRTPGGLPEGAQEIRGDLQDAGSWHASLDGVDVAVHAAAVAADWGPYGELRATSRRVHAALFRELASRGVKRLVLVSATSVYGGGLAGAVREDQPFRICGELCGDTKIDAEELAWQHHREKGFELAVVRPVTCYGPGDRHFLPRLASDLKQRRSAWIGGGEFPASLCHADTVGQIVALCAGHPAARGHAFHVRDTAGISWRRFIEILSGALDSPLPQHNIPVPLARFLARGMTAAAGFLRLSSPPPLTPHAVDLLTSQADYSIESARSLLGFTVPRDTAAAVREVVHGLARGGDR